MADEAVVRIEEQIKSLFSGQERIEFTQQKCEEEHKKEINEIYKEIKALKEQFANRLPIWASMFIAALTAICGWALGR